MEELKIEGNLYWFSFGIIHNVWNIPQQINLSNFTTVLPDWSMALDP